MSAFFADFIVIKNGCRPLIGRDILNKLQFRFDMINSISAKNKVNEIVEKFSDVFDDKLGMFRYSEVELKLKQGSVPKFIKPRPVPFAFKAKLECELDRLESLGIIVKTESSDWGTPLVTVIKKRWHIKSLCGLFCDNQQVFGRS